MLVLGGCVLQRGMLLRCLVGDVANLAFRSSLQALRAETMVERFTARMHVTCGDGNCYRQVILFVDGGGYGGQLGRWVLWGFCIVFIDCSGSARWILIPTRQILLCVVFVV